MFESLRDISALPLTLKWILLPQKTRALPMKVGVIVFPGSNCDHDAWYAVHHNLGADAEFIWHDSTSLGNADAVILPGHRGEIGQAGYGAPG